MTYKKNCKAKITVIALIISIISSSASSTTIRRWLDEVHGYAIEITLVLPESQGVYDDALLVSLDSPELKLQRFVITNQPTSIFDPVMQIARKVYHSPVIMTAYYTGKRAPLPQEFLHLTYLTHGGHEPMHLQIPLHETEISEPLKDLSGPTSSDIDSTLLRTRSFRSSGKTHADIIFSHLSTAWLTIKPHIPTGMLAIFLIMFLALSSLRFFSKNFSLRTFITTLIKNHQTGLLILLIATLIYILSELAKNSFLKGF